MMIMKMMITEWTMYVLICKLLYLIIIIIIINILYCVSEAFYKNEVQHWTRTLDRLVTVNIWNELLWLILLFLLLQMNVSWCMLIYGCMLCPLLSDKVENCWWMLYNIVNNKSWW